MEATAATMEAISTMKAANRSACHGAMTHKARSATGKSRPTHKAATADERMIAWTIEAMSPVPRPSVEAVVPGASADEDAADKPARAIVAVRRARVWVIRVVAVSADGRTNRGDHSGSDSNTDSDSNLGLGSAGSHAGESDEEPDQCRIF